MNYRIMKIQASKNSKKRGDDNYPPLLSFEIYYSGLHAYQRRKPFVKVSGRKFGQRPHYVNHNVRKIKQ